MDLLRDNVRAVYRKCFLAAFGSALISCIYGVVDMTMVGQYQGPDGTAALAVVALVWNVIYSLGLLTGIGGSVLLIAKRGSGAAFSVFWTALSLSWPNLYIRIFMRPTAAILTMAPGIVRTYAVSFLLLPLNIFSTYYFQAILKPGAAFFVSVARGLVISGALILLLPAVLGPTAIWWAMPATELLVACYAVSAMRRATRALSSC